MALDQIPIGKFSLMTRLSPKALRIYDKKNLLVPEEKDDITGYRYYTIHQIEDGIRIKMLVNMGFSLSEIETILGALAKEDHVIVHNFVAKRLSETQLEIERLRKIEEVLVNPKKTLDLLNMQISTPIVKDIPGFRVLSKQAFGTYGETIGSLINSLMGEIYNAENRKNFVKINGPIMFIAHDQGYKEENAHIEVVIPITGRVSVEDDSIELKNLPATKVASLLYTGSYENIGNGYQKLFEYIGDHKLNAHGLTREVYLNSPEHVAEEELLTEIHIPIYENGDKNNAQD